MTYIILAAGKGTRLHPITLNTPKCMYKLDEKTTVLQRMVNLLNKYDPHADIVVVTGFKREQIEYTDDVDNFIYNPFYSITNSIASLWFARDYLEGDVCIINGDIVMSETLAATLRHSDTCIYMDSTIKTTGDYNVKVHLEKVVVMSKQLKDCSGEYAGITKLKMTDALALCTKLHTFSNFDQWYEDVLVQMIFEGTLELRAADISNFLWTEIDTVDDLHLAKHIHALKT